MLCINIYLNGYDIFSQNFEAEAIWCIIMVRKYIREDLQFNCIVKWIFLKFKLATHANEYTYSDVQKYMFFR